MTTEVTTAPFVRTHGKAPRGEGFWAFQASDTRVGFSQDLTGEVFVVFGMYIWAKRQACEHFADTRFGRPPAEFVAVLG